MKDLIITSHQIKRELRFFLICFILAFILNILGIVIYKTNWVEIFTQIGYVLAIAFVLYLFILLVRIIILLIVKLFRKKK